VKSENNQVPSTSQTSGLTDPEVKEGIPRSEMKIIIVIGIVVVLFLSVLMGVLYMWAPTPIVSDEGISVMHFTVEDGHYQGPTQGCFFLIRAGHGVDIDPYRFTFYVCEKGSSPKKLDTNFREYMVNPPYRPDPNSGDLNRTYDWTQDGELWSKDEYIGFDMPMEDMGIDITDGNVYEVTIKDPKGEVIFKDTFVFVIPGP